MLKILGRLSDYLVTEKGFEKLLLQFAFRVQKLPRLELLIKYNTNLILLSLHKISLGWGCFSIGKYNHSNE